MMKNICVWLVLLLGLSLNACVTDPGVFHFNYDELKKIVVSVELIYYDNPNAILLGSFEHDNLALFDFDKMEIIETLSNEKLEDFLQELSEETFIAEAEHLNSPQGMSVRIIYRNGDFEVISYSDSFLHSYSGSFRADGTVKRFIGDGFYHPELINKYFETQID